jgi:hypothetical protein
MATHCHVFPGSGICPEVINKTFFGMKSQQNVWGVIKREWKTDVINYSNETCAARKKWLHTDM